MSVTDFTSNTFTVIFDKLLWSQLFISTWGKIFSKLCSSWVNKLATLHQHLSFVLKEEVDFDKCANVTKQTVTKVVRIMLRLAECLHCATVSLNEQSCLSEDPAEWINWLPNYRWSLWGPSVPAPGVGTGECQSSGAQLWEVSKRGSAEELEVADFFSDL